MDASGRRRTLGPAWAPCPAATVGARTRRNVGVHGVGPVAGRLGAATASAALHEEDAGCRCLPPVGQCLPEAR